ncbi:hypothetical protein KN815_31635 [Streptomyces sp. 4503]|uniref:Uncharacterized protein n=1 Tax=Streptomyces niphimycinicus TaxID=2842201 RepID=A0ABS6CNC5_9ACTN|nr:hypothetical protein [Streptomyces niphimycinicus]MBU3868437.1 hypothetical protein [Streptomyces niphimycinicus]
MAAATLGGLLAGAGGLAGGCGVASALPPRGVLVAFKAGELGALGVGRGLEFDEAVGDFHAVDDGPVIPHAPRLGFVPGEGLFRVQPPLILPARRTVAERPSGGGTS